MWRSRRSMGASIALPAVMLLLGFALSAAGALWLHRSNLALASQDFERGVEQVNREIGRRFLTPVYGLNGARGMYAGNPQVDRAEFRAYVESRNLAEEFPGVRGFGFIERVSRARLPAFLDEQRMGGAPQFALRQLGESDADDHLLVKFIEPDSLNDTALGLDVASERNRRIAARMAIDTGQPAMTAPITLVQDQRQRPGALLFVPVYRHAAKAQTTDERREALIGLLYAPIVVGDLLQGVAEMHRDRLRFRLFDTTGESSTSVRIFDSAALTDSSPTVSAFSSRLALALHGRSLTMQVDSLPEFDAEAESVMPWAFFAAGALASALLALLLNQQLTGRSRAETLAGQMTADLEKLALVARRTSNAVVITDAQRRITWVNGGFERITGLTAAQAIGQPMAWLKNEGTGLDTLRRLDAALDGAEAFTGTLVRHRSDGKPYWVESEIQPLRDGRGAVSGFMLIESDISERKRAEAVQQRMATDLRRNNELLASIIENLPCGFSVFDGELKLVIANQQFRSLLGFPASLFEQPMVRFEDLVRFNAEQGTYGDGDVESVVRSIIDRARASGQSTQLDRAQPGHSKLEIRSAPLPGGGFVSTYSDVSSRIWAEAEIKRGADLLRGAIDAIDEAFVLYDPDDRLVLCNEKYREIYRPLPGVLVAGARFEDIVRSGAESGRIPAAIGRVDEWVAERIEKHRSGDATLIQQLDNGRMLRVVDRKMPDGHTVGFRIDITELAKATETAQAASRAKSQFLANTSHEIRTPMNAILGMLALLGKTSLTAQQADYAHKTESAARSLLGLLNDILDFSKVEAGKMALDRHPFDTEQLLRDLAVILSADVGDKRVEVLFDVDPSLPRCLIGDAMRLKQILINLGSNAIKFTAAGEVVVSVDVESLDNAHARLRFAVSDTGIGIAPENQVQIFNAFTQGESSTTRRFGGTGLGVSISQRLVALMGGALQIDSAVGQGSRFHFAIVLPIGGSEYAESAPSPRAPGKRVLVIDDNATARDVFARMGQFLGWHVDLAEGGERGLDLLRGALAAGRPYQAVFVDWMMPRMDGWQTIRQIHGLGLAGNAPVIVMVTAHARAMLNQRSGNEQRLIDRFLVKPVTTAMMADAVDQAATRVAQSKPVPMEPTSARRLAGLRLLIVEDNLNNQQIARELLEAEGATVQLANDGQQGVEAVAASGPGFDLVLMDLQMPVLDGFAATSRIRHDLGRRDLPIVAMTANAMVADREACLSVGMNDHVGKPFDLDHLVRVIRRHAGRSDAVSSTAELAVLPLTVQDAAAAAGVDIVTAIGRLGGRHETYARMLRAFIKELASMRSQLAEMCITGDMKGVLRLQHNLKGLAATFGATALSASAAQSERQLAGDRSLATMQLAADATHQAIDAASPGLDELLLALDQVADPTPPDRAT